MTLAIKWGDDTSDVSGMIYFDAVTVYNRSYTGQVTKHPVDLGGNITDHFIRENPRFTLSGVISSVDISTNVATLSATTGETIINERGVVAPVQVGSSDQSIISRLLPASISQFVGSTGKPDVVLDAERQEDRESIRELITNLTNGVRFNEKTGQFDPYIEIIKLYEFDGVTLRRVTGNLVITSIAYNESPESGEALYVDLQIEQVTFAYLKKTQIPKDVAQSLRGKSAPKADKGKVDSTPVDDEISNKDRDPERNAYGQLINSEQFKLGQPLDLGGI